MNRVICSNAACTTCWDNSVRDFSGDIEMRRVISYEVWAKSLMHLAARGLTVRELIGWR